MAASCTGGRIEDAGSVESDESEGEGDDTAHDRSDEAERDRVEEQFGAVGAESESFDLGMGDGEDSRE